MVLFILVSGISVAVAYAWIGWRGYQKIKYLQQTELFWEKTGKETLVRAVAVKEDS
jgi:hypothetical protein